jgi:hypothetical protein
MTIERITEFTPSDRYVYDFVLCHLRQRLGANRHTARRVLLRHLDQSRAAGNLQLL